MLEATVNNTIPDLVRQLQGSQGRIQDRINGIGNRAIRDLLRIARQVAHRKSGKMIEGLYIEGPFVVGTGILESQIKSTAPYTGHEIARGADHDFPTITLQQGASILDRALRDIEEIVIQETGAGRG